jgi:hypothetical protein
MEVRARVAKVGQGSSASDVNKQPKLRPQARAQPKPKYQLLSVENLAGFSDLIEAGGGQVDALWDEGDDTGSNTDFELAVRMKRRWV